MTVEFFEVEGKSIGSPERFHVETVAEAIDKYGEYLVESLEREEDHEIQVWVRYFIDHSLDDETDLWVSRVEAEWEKSFRFTIKWTYVISDTAVVE